MLSPLLGAGGIIVFRVVRRCVHACVPQSLWTQMTIFHKPLGGFSPNVQF